MRIYILPVDNILQPQTQPFNYPRHNNNYGVEQDFLEFLAKNQTILTDNPNLADYHYLPVYWTRWHLNHKNDPDSLTKLDQYVNQVITNDMKTFTICQHYLGPVINLGRTKVFLASRKGEMDFDIPLLCLAHKLPPKKPSKKYLASFIGTKNHPIRRKMIDNLRQKKDIYLYCGNKGSEFFVQKILESYITLCPRGNGGSSFRFFETMQLGVVPFLISDLDIRPFKQYINWNMYSFFTNNVKKVNEIIRRHPKDLLVSMGLKCASLWKNELMYGKWCRYVIKELERLK